MRETTVSSKKRYLDVHYRRLVRDGWSGGTLAARIAAALDARPPGSGSRFSEDWRLRVTAAPGDDDQLRFMNNFHVADSYVFGNLCSYTKAEMQAVVATDSSAVPEVDIEDLEAPGGSDYLHGIAYWLAVDDHCYVVQDMRVRTKALEEYLTWLVGEALATEDVVTLQAAFDISDLGQDVHDVAVIEVGGLAPETVPDRRADDRGTVSSVVRRRRSIADSPVFSKSREVLEVAFGTLETERLLAGTPEDAALCVMLHVSYLAQSREVDRSSIRELGVALRNLDDGEVRVRGKDGTITRGEARLKARMPFWRAWENGNLLDLEHALSQLLETHRRFLADGKISSD